MSLPATFTSGSVEETRVIAFDLASRLNPGNVLCFEGDLGAGKTTFIAALCAELGCDDEVVSPTFTLENRYRAQRPSPRGIHEIVHVDLYRTEGNPEEELIAAMQESREEGALLAIEWSQPVEALFHPLLRISFLLQGGPADPPPREIQVESIPEGWAHAASFVESVRSRLEYR